MDEDGYFDERVAASYHESSADIIHVALVDPPSTCWATSPAAGAISGTKNVSVWEKAAS